MASKTIHINVADALLLSGLFLLCILFAGEPDIADGIIYWMTDGALYQEKEVEAEPVIPAEAED